MVANEPSGDQLGASLIQALQECIPDIHFEGVGGPRMQAAGCHSLVPMEQLSVMGLVEVVRHLPRLWRIRRGLARHFLAHPPHVFVGIDAPDFNLRLEEWLHRAHIPTVHYVSPTVWAWRPGRVRAMRRSLDLMLSVFPFEVAFLERHRVPVRYVGHPLAEEIPLEHDRAGARARLGLPAHRTVLAVLPGSRVSEVQRLARVFLETAQWCLERRPQLHFVIPLVNAPIRALVEAAWQAVDPQLPVTLVDGNSRDVLTAADLVLTASGTATLEALLHQRPMVVAYRLNPLTYWLATRLKLVKVPYVALSNLLVGEALAPELLQDACRPAGLGEALLSFLDNPERMRQIQERYRQVHQGLRCDSRHRAAEAVLGVMGLWSEVGHHESGAS